MDNQSKHAQFILLDRNGQGTGQSRENLSWSRSSDLASVESRDSGTLPELSGIIVPKCRDSLSRRI